MNDLSQKLLELLLIQTLIQGLYIDPGDAFTLPFLHRHIASLLHCCVAALVRLHTHRSVRLYSYSTVTS